MSRLTLRFAAIGVAAALGVLAALPAQAACYYIYGPKNELVYRSTRAPVDLSKPISQTVRARYSGAHLTMLPDEADCPDLAAYGPTPAAPVARSDGASPLEASPLFRNIESRSAYGSDAYVAKPTRGSAVTPAGR